MYEDGGRKLVLEATQKHVGYGEAVVEGLREAGIRLVTAVPESLLKDVYRRLPSDPDIRYIPVTNEAEMPGIMAGAYLGGTRGVMIMENSGLRQACEPLSRLAYVHHMPLVFIMGFRGDFGERNWWGHNHAQTMEPMLNALRFPYRVIRRIEDIKSHIKRAWLHADSSQWPVGLVLSGECVEVPPYARD